MNIFRIPVGKCEDNGDGIYGETPTEYGDGTIGGDTYL